MASRLNNTLYKIPKNILAGYVEIIITTTLQHVTTLVIQDLV